MVNDTNNAEISLKEILLSIRAWMKYLKTKILYILSALLVGAGIGYIIYSFSDRYYVAEKIFIIEGGQDSKNMSQIPTGLSLLGISMGQESGLFTGENLIWLYSSSSLLTKTLLKGSEIDSSELLIERFILLDDELEELKSDLYGEDSLFVYNSKLQEGTKEKIKQNSLLKFAIQKIQSKYLTVNRNEDARSIIHVEFKSKSSDFSVEFINKLVDGVNAEYLDTSVQQYSDQVYLLQKKVDQIESDLNSAMFNRAIAISSNPNANRSKQTLNVSSERKGIDVQASTSLYIQMVQQLEAAKLNLERNRPLIKVIEEPTLPLISEGKNLFRTLGMYSFLFGFLCVLFLVVKEYVRILMHEGN